MDVLSTTFNILAGFLGFERSLKLDRSSASGSTALNQWLYDQKSQFLADMSTGDTDWVIVTGNEAGDLDSIASAIGYAKLASESKVIPLVQTPRDGLHLRPENMFAFSMASIQTEALLTPSDLPVPLRSQSFQFVLVDHNSLLPSCNGEVVAILDHHDDEKKHIYASPRVIKPAGSCASIVATQFSEVWNAEMSDELRPVAILLLCAILIDTGGLKTGGKAVSTDYDAAQLLIPHTGFATGSVLSNAPARLAPELDHLSRMLAEKKASVDNLSVKDLLRRDYKEYLISGLRIGLSTVPVGLKVLIKRDIASFWNDIDHYMKEKGLDVLGILTTYRSAKRKKHRRQLLFIVEPGHLDVEEKLFKGIGSDSGLQCEERRVAGLGSRRGRCWRQGNVKATRKVVAPLVKHLLESP